MKRVVLLLCLGLSGGLLFAQIHTVTNAEYFWDSDPGPGFGTPISIVSEDTVALDGDVSTSGLSAGVHVLNVRVQRDDGLWGGVTRRMVRVGIGTTFEAAEVFWDNDPGQGSATPLAITAGGVMNETAWDVPDVERGFHWFNLRCKSGGTWSAATARTVRVGSALIDGAEAYFDTDPGEGNGIPVDVETGLDVTAYDSTVSVLAAGEGFHNLYLRFRGGGVWSFPKYQSLRVGPWVDGGINRITGGEFFVDTDPGEGNGCPLIAEDGVFDEREELMRRYLMGSDLGLGQHVIGIRAKDAGGRWYNTLRDTVQIIESHLVTTARRDTTGNYVRLMWTTYPEALEYRVHYDSSATGTFTNYVSVLPPDTSLELTPPAGGNLIRQFHRVVAVQVEAEPCEGQTNGPTNRQAERER